MCASDPVYETCRCAGNENSPERPAAASLQRGTKGRGLEHPEKFQHYHNDYDDADDIKDISAHAQVLSAAGVCGEKFFARVLSARARHALWPRTPVGASEYRPEWSPRLREELRSLLPQWVQPAERVKEKESLCLKIGGFFPSPPGGLSVSLSRARDSALLPPRRSIPTRTFDGVCV